MLWVDSEILYLGKRSGRTLHSKAVADNIVILVLGSADVSAPAFFGVGDADDVATGAGILVPLREGSFMQSIDLLQGFTIFGFLLI